MQIKDAKLQELLDGLDAEITPEPCSLDKWLKSEGYYPGSSRMKVCDLHERYKKWHAQHIGNIEKALTLRQFGKEMVRRFKRGRDMHGAFYYISRRKDPKIPAEIKCKEGELKKNNRLEDKVRRLKG